MLSQIVDVFLHLDQHLNAWAGQLGPWTYVLLFAILFAETGLVVTPFLPGDSLLFAVGALAATAGSPLHIVSVTALLVVAAIAGDARELRHRPPAGPRVFRAESSWLLNKKHLLRTQHFYEKHGGKTIFLARFVPIVRTFAPFVAGIGQMQYRRFGLYNVAGGVTWVVLFTGAGYFFGGLPWVKDRFHIVILAIIGISVLPIVWEFARAWLEGRRQPRLPESGEK
ncbi:MAG: DedA family protein [Anaerolineae bacterium]